MSHQDFEPVIFKPKQPVKRGTTVIAGQTITAVKPQGGKNVQHTNINSNKIEKKIEEGDLALPKISHDLKIQIQQARQNKKLTQKQLAQACNMQETMIRDYENGKCIPTSSDLVKMGKVLGVILRNK